MPSFWGEHHGLLVLEPEPTSTDTIRIYGKKRPNVFSEVKVKGTTISLTHNASTADLIEDSGNGFGSINDGDVVQVTDGDNDGLVVLVVTAAAGKLTLHTRDLVTTEAAGTSITIETVSHFEEEYQHVLVSLATLRVAQNLGLDTKVLRTRYVEDRIEMWDGMDYRPQSIRVGYRDF